MSTEKSDLGDDEVNEEEAFETAYFACNGVADDVSWLALRWRWVDGPFTPEDGESAIMRGTPKRGNSDVFRYEANYIKQGWITGLWRSDSRTLYASDADGKILVGRWQSKAGKYPEDFEELQITQGTLAGIWGLADDFIFAWGGVDGKLYHWNGRKWSEVASPGQIVRMHGKSRDLIYAVGYEGLLARFDGGTWTQVTVPTTQTLTGIHVASPDEVYASGQGGVLLEGSEHGWGVLLEGPDLAPIHDVCKWNDKVWLACGENGLFTLEPGTNSTTNIRDTWDALAFDCRKDLLIASTNFIVTTKDGADFDAIGEDVYHEQRAGSPIGQ